MNWITELWSTYKTIKQIQETGNRFAPWLGDYGNINPVMRRGSAFPTFRRGNRIDND